MKKLVTAISQAICYGESITCPEACSEFVWSQVENSPWHIKSGLKIVGLLFLLLSLIYGLGRPFYSYDSKYRQITFIEFFEDLSKTTRMFVSFIRSMSLIYICDNNLA